MGTAKQSRAVRQEQIAQAALGVVRRTGLKGLSLAAIAREIGLVPSAIYRHFPNGKDEVIDAMLDLLRGRLQANVAAVCEDMADALERLRLLQIRHIHLVRENEAIPRLIFSEEVFGKGHERRAKVFGIIQSYLQAVAGIVRQGQEEGQLRDDVEAGAVALLFLGLVQPAAVLWHVSDGAFDVTQETQKTWEIFAQAIRRPDGLARKVN
jgi:AcrR family transcriptional regulator